jgi:hypothetical protein
MGQFDLAGKCVIALASGVCLWLLGCSAGEPISPVAYDSAKALFSICNRKDSEALGKLKTQIDDSLAAQTISASEARQLRQVLAAAEAGNWETGLNRARSLLERQQSRTPPGSREDPLVRPRTGPRSK